MKTQSDFKLLNERKFHKTFAYMIMQIRFNQTQKVTFSRFI